MIELSLPTPPSVNNLFFNRLKGRGITPEYRAWRVQAGWELKQQRPKPVKGQVCLSYTFEPGRADLDNLAKPLNDLLVEHRLIEGDGPDHVRQIILEYWDGVKGVKVKVLPFV